MVGAGTWIERLTVAYPTRPDHLSSPGPQIAECETEMEQLSAKEPWFERLAKRRGDNKAIAAIARKIIDRYLACADQEGR